MTDRGSTPSVYPPLTMSAVIGWPAQDAWLATISDITG